MKRIEYIQMLADLFSFKTIPDDKQNTYVVYGSSTLSGIADVEDRTQFEALENHVHLLNNIKITEFPHCVRMAPQLGQALLNCLQAAFPDRHFCVFVTVTLGDSMIIRFHQKWPGEAPYYTLEGWNTEKEAVFGLEC